ncbi:hypothetical protein GJ744_008864 [Endocarpon pusillum]|uniref:Uncharacterized protein n=1 Tax=Endocarpon pusillum TaxID=364733 RepID=A0A8H7AQF3_9EURO|nr:hypothetical protein GJ744_008864 [Endocarpon pusillum]
MPPKSTDAAVAAATKDTNFLAACFMNMKTKPVVDNAAVAAQLSMSTGGVANKLRPIIKAMEDAGALWTTDQPPTANRARGGGAKATPKKVETEAKKDNGSENEDATVPVTPKPKARSLKKTPAKTPSSSAKRGRKGGDFDVDSEGAVEEEASTRKKAKVAPGQIKEEVEIKENIKKESDGSSAECGE